MVRKKRNGSEEADLTAKTKADICIFFKETAKVYLQQKLIRRKRKQQSAGPVCVRPGTAGLVIDIECSRVRDNLWMYLTSFITNQIGVGLAAVQRKLPDCVVVGLQLYSKDRTSIRTSRKASRTANQSHPLMHMLS